MGTLTWNSCHSIRTNYLRVHGDVMEKHGADELTRDQAVRCICVGWDNSGFTVKGLTTNTDFSWFYDETKWLNFCLQHNQNYQYVQIYKITSMFRYTAPDLHWAVTVTLVFIQARCCFYHLLTASMQKFLITTLTVITTIAVSSRTDTRVLLTVVVH